jgi:hypothetical protein
MQVKVWEHNDRKGSSYTYGPGVYSNLGDQGFNDKISSLEVSGSAVPDNPETIACRQNAGDPSAEYGLREAFPNQDPWWQCPAGWVDTGCNWGMGADYEKRQCRKK